MALMDTKRFFHQNQAGFQEEDTDYFFLPGNDSGSAAGFHCNQENLGPAGSRHGGQT